MQAVQAGKKSDSSLLSTGPFQSQHVNDNRQDSRNTWHGFSVTKRDENLRFLKGVVADTRNRVTGSNHLAQDIRLRFPDLTEPALDAISRIYGAQIAADITTMCTGFNSIQGKFAEHHDLSKLREVDKLHRYFIRNGFGECGVQTYHCRKNLQNTGVPSENIWTLFFKEVNETQASDLPASSGHNTHALMLIAENDAMKSFITLVKNIIARKGAHIADLDYIAITMDSVEFLTAMDRMVPMAIIVDPFFNKVIPLSDLMQNASSLHDVIGVNGAQAIVFADTVKEKPLTDHDTENSEFEIKEDDDALQTVQSIRQVVHRIKLRDLVSTSGLNDREKKKILESINGANYNLAFRQSTFGKANRVFDYLFDNRDALGIDISATGKSGKTAQMYAEKMSNTHAMARLKSLNEVA